MALVVDAEYRRRGIASVLVEHCRNFARQYGATEIEVTSRRTRTDADRFYTDAGFADVSDRSRRYISDLQGGQGSPCPAARRTTSGAPLARRSQLLMKAIIESG